MKSESQYIGIHVPKRYLSVHICSDDYVSQKEKEMIFIYSMGKVTMPHHKDVEHYNIFQNISGVLKHYNTNKCVVYD